jgi:hypothetical protein
MILKLREQGRAAEAFPTNQALGEFLLARNFESEGKTLLVFLSNGSFDGVIGKVAGQFLEK